MYGGPVDVTGFYNAGGWGPVIIANVPPGLWFLAVSILLLRKRQSVTITPTMTPIKRG
jgi:hypothetical protein